MISLQAARFRGDLLKYFKIVPGTAVPVISSSSIASSDVCLCVGFIALWMFVFCVCEENKTVL